MWYALLASFWDAIWDPIPGGSPMPAELTADTLSCYRCFLFIAFRWQRLRFNNFNVRILLHFAQPGRSVIIIIIIIIIMIRSDLYTESGQTVQGSFLAVSKPNFASKYLCESSRRDLQYTALHRFAPLSHLIFVLKNSFEIANFVLNFAKKFANVCRNC